MSTDWMDEALCAQVTQEIFFPEKGGRTEPARTICAACDVRLQCLEYAQTNYIDEGVWGGLTVVQRQRLRRNAA